MHGNHLYHRLSFREKTKSPIHEFFFYFLLFSISNNYRRTLDHTGYPAIETWHIHTEVDKIKRIEREIAGLDWKIDGANILMHNDANTTEWDATWKNKGITYSYTYVSMKAERFVETSDPMTSVLQQVDRSDNFR